MRRTRRLPAIANVGLLGLSLLAGGSLAASAQQAADLPPEMIARLAAEKEGRRACKVEICTAFARPGAGAPIGCEVVKTWTQKDIVDRIVGGSYVWRYGHTQCSVKLALDRDLIAKAMTEAKTMVSFPEHAFVCNVDDKDAGKGKAFSVTVKASPVIAFEKGEAKSVTLEPVKAEGSAVASAAVTSLMAMDKVSGLVSKAAAAEINAFLFEKCKEDGIEIARK
jgi:hypothetical protein